MVVPALLLRDRAVQLSHELLWHLFDALAVTEMSQPEIPQTALRDRYLNTTAPTDQCIEGGTRRLQVYLRTSPFHAV